MTRPEEPAHDRSTRRPERGGSDDPARCGTLADGAGESAGRSPVGERSRSSTGRFRRWAFRLAAIGFGFSLVVLVEVFLAAFGMGDVERQEDPFIGFQGIRPLFLRSEDGTRYEIPQARQNFFAYESFPAAKPADEFRIFCLGGSTVRGRPYSTETSFTRWLEIALNNTDATRRWRVINCGGVSYASYRLVPILKEVLRYEPDLILVYTGHNEFLEARTYGHIKRRSAFVEAALSGASRLRTYCLLRSLLRSVTGPRAGEVGAERTALQVEVDSILDYRDGLAEYHRDEIWREDVVRHYRWNLERMIAIAREADVPLVLMDPVSNLRDCPPFKSEPNAALSPEQTAALESLWEQARGAYVSDLPHAIQLLTRAVAIDHGHAALHYQLAECYDCARTDAPGTSALRVGQGPGCVPVEDSGTDARHPGRRLPGIGHAAGARSPTNRTGVPRGDRRRFDAGRSCSPLDPRPPVDRRRGPGGDDRRGLGPGRQAMGQAGTSRPGTEHLKSLDSLYFEVGRRRLEDLRRWTRGESSLVKPATPGEKTRRASGGSG